MSQCGRRSALFVDPFQRTGLTDRFVSFESVGQEFAFALIAGDQLTLELLPSATPLVAAQPLLIWDGAQCHTSQCHSRGLPVVTRRLQSALHLSSWRVREVVLYLRPQVLQSKNKDFITGLEFTVGFDSWSFLDILCTPIPRQLLS